MSDIDAHRWNRRYADRGPVQLSEAALPAPFAEFADAFPSTGLALDLACGRGGAAVWLARRGMMVQGYDVSAVAVGQARNLAGLAGCAERCRFDVADLDAGFPPGPCVDVLVAGLFRDARLDAEMISRVAPAGLLAVSALSEVGAAPGRFRAAPGELTRAFAALDLLGCGESSGVAWLIARKPALAKIDRCKTSR
ncbi:SAM-dependent methyltransferase [Mycolicibacterium duvalii]|uniref:SAM-dependent methyltransferase n=1 Tax=Mycolicibacterium duvalii TaxID=39688 RepID=A0A7I7JZ11_9MYCO|nr:class I SAM-dependent methyltransferase [Mycolicibacterium duvalii]MCV7369585.1 methyltransferase domain-containing protein [Mycolicibacterium duvalii]PEG42209.1 SAM-dependent methyltransferase [Mycolicibacterium duvalii]BBX16312.1 SAM-dependent methyltransferase [Mycolicibacterium duvalii]